MNGRLCGSLLRRFLNADENIQDPYNTQNYNKYGYVMNNPLMYNDPSGEFWWIVAGAVIGAYVTGVKANGSYYPWKWDWGATWTKIVTGAAIGALSGGIGATAGASALAASGVTGGVLGGMIAGGVGGAVGGAISGAMTAGLFGENIAKGALTGFAIGAIGGAVLGGIAGGVSQIAQNAKVTSTGVGTKGNIWTGATVAEGRSPWAFNNTAKVTPKTPTVGGTPKVGKLELGEMTGEFERTVGYKINPQTEQMTPIKSFDGDNASWGKSFNYKHGGEMSTIEHINYRHSYNTGFSNVSKFSEGTSVKMIKGYVDQAIRYGNPIKGGYEYNFGKVIGTGSNGAPACQSVFLYAMVG